MVKYAYPKRLEKNNRQWLNNTFKTPVWCAVDLRDGNQALPDPLPPEQKRRYFKMLCELGFKEIEIGFPSASADDFNFCRELIENNLIPEDVTISVLTQAREHLIRRTFEALKGCKKAVLHYYIATSDLHMHWVFNKTQEETKKIAIDSVKLIRELADQMPESDIKLEFSPEEFTDSELPFVIDLCDSVIENWQPKVGEKVILNLPATVERRLPFEYGDMIAEFCDKQKYRNKSIISLHAHNDMGTAVASTEMALLAGADRVEGTLFGHGERSGNVDLVTLILNLEYFGVNTGINFKQIEKVRDEVIELTAMPVNPRHPYAGELVFSAFSGSHQDAIHKGFSQKEAMLERYDGWKIPYLHIDPQHLGRSYERFIRINSQSGKGGVAHVLSEDYGVKLPRDFLINFSKFVQNYTETAQREISSNEIWSLFARHYISPKRTLNLINYWPRPDAEDPRLILGEAHITFGDQTYKLHATGQGPLVTFVQLLRQLPIPEFKLVDYTEDSLGHGADAEALAMVCLSNNEGEHFYGAGIDSNINQAAVNAVISAINNLINHATPPEA